MFLISVKLKLTTMTKSKEIKSLLFRWYGFL